MMALNISISVKMVQLGCFFHQNISFTLKIGGRIESKIKVKMYAQEDTAVILIISLINENTLASWESNFNPPDVTNIKRILASRNHFSSLFL